MPSQMMSMIRAEVVAVFGRWSGRGALVLALVVGLLAVGGLEAASRAAQNIKGNHRPAIALRFHYLRTS